MFPSQYFPFPLSVSHTCTFAAHSSSSTRCSYQKDKWAKPGNLWTKPCSVGNRGTLDSKVLVFFRVLTRYHSLRVEQLRRESDTLCTRELPVWNAIWAKQVASDRRAELIGLPAGLHKLTVSQLSLSLKVGSWNWQRQTPRLGFCTGVWAKSIQFFEIWEREREREREKCEEQVNDTLYGGWGRKIITGLTVLQVSPLDLQLAVLYWWKEGEGVDRWQH